MLPQFSRLLKYVIYHFIRLSKNDVVLMSYFEQQFKFKDKAQSFIVSISNF